MQFCPYFIYFGISKEPENLSKGLIFQADPSGDAGTPLENSSSSTGSREAEQIARRFSASIHCEIKKKRGKKGKGEKITRNYTGREEDSSSTCSSYRVLVPPPCPRHPSVPGGARLAPWETTPRARPCPGKQTQQKEEKGKKKGKKSKRGVEFPEPARSGVKRVAAGAGRGHTAAQRGVRGCACP